MDKKLLYLTKTLSRTKRKDFENYIINSIWNGVKCSDLLPVSQQYINSNGNHYFIDLYFPQLNIGIECDEPYHEKQKTKDIEREISIFDVLNRVTDISSYRPFHISVSETTSINDLDTQINKCIKEIITVITSKIREGNFENGWKMIFNDPYEFYSGKNSIRIDDNIRFDTTKDIYNALFGKNYKKSPRRGGVLLSNGILVWTPQLAVDDKKHKSGWHNDISRDGCIIREFSIKSSEENEKRHAINKHIGQKRIVFTKTKDMVTGLEAYRFVGVFIADHFDSNHRLIYKRINNEYRFK